MNTPLIGTIEITIETTINVDANTAKRKVTGWVISEVANLMGGTQPRLVIGKRTFWRVPVVLTSSKTGSIGEVGAVGVDTETGELLVNDALKERLLTNAASLVGSAPLAAMR